MMNYFDEINGLAYIFLVEINNLPANKLSITIKTATIAEQDEDLIVGNKNIGPVKQILQNGSEIEYNFLFNSYGAYQVTNESFTTLNDAEERIGRLFCIYSKSNYIEYVQANTIVDYTYDYDKTLKHYSVNCLNHVIDIITIVEPVITKIKGPF